MKGQTNILCTIFIVIQDANTLSKKESDPQK